MSYEEWMENQIDLVEEVEKIEQQEDKSFDEVIAMPRFEPEYESWRDEEYDWNQQFKH